MSPATSHTTPLACGRGEDPTYNRLVRRRNLAASAAAFFFALLVVTALIDGVTSVHEDRSFAVGASPRLVVRDHVGGGLRGGIEVRAAEGDRIRVEGKVHATWRVRYALEQRDGDVVLEVEPRHWLGWLSLLGPPRFTITAPPDTRLDVEAWSAPIEVRGIAGGGSVRTTNGRIRLADAGGQLSATTTNGGITAVGFAGAAKLQTTNGGIDVERGRGSFDVATTNGSIELNAELAAGERHRAETTNGGVTVRLLGEPSLRVDARTINGAIVAPRLMGSPHDEGPEARRWRPKSARRGSGNELVGTIGGGAGDLRIRTTNGGISID